MSDRPAWLTAYLEIKQDHPDHLLLYRMGDFYELFFDDAVTAAKTLNITLTRRGRRDGNDIPMCGVPVHSHGTYAALLAAAGYSIAVCEQVDDAAAPKNRLGKRPLNRFVRVLAGDGIEPSHPQPFPQTHCPGGAS